MFEYHMPILLAAGAVPPFLTEVVALIVAGALIAYICFRLRLVPIVGFLLAGVFIGPNALGLVNDQTLVDATAEIGVILLLFTIGIEFSLQKLARIQRLIFGGGVLQVGLSIAVTSLILLAFGVDWRIGIFTGMLVGLSSTAIVLKLLAESGESNSEPGQISLGLLIFQDLAIVVMVLLVPILSGTGGGGLTAVLAALATAMAIIILVLVVARRIMPKVLEAVARTCSPELFLLAVIAICFGTAYLTSLAGVSLSLGAFLAGLMVSESRFSQHALTETLPLQILFSATFFVSVGMLLDVGFLLTNLPIVLGVIAAVLVIKIVTTGASVFALGYKLPVAAASALMLAQIGEFSFVLERAGRDVGLFPAGMGTAGSQTFIASTVVLMVLTPILMRAGNRLSRHAIENPRSRRVPASDGSPPHELTHELEDHIVVSGYGQTARRLAHVLERSGIPYIVTTLSPEGASAAESGGLRVIRGDSTKAFFLRHAGIRNARMLVIADDNPAMAHRIVSVARQLNPKLRIVVKIRFLADIERLTAAGASVVLAEELEAVGPLISEVLGNYGIQADEIEDYVGLARRDEATGDLEMPENGQSPAGPQPVSPDPAANDLPESAFHGSETEQDFLNETGIDLHTEVIYSPKVDGTVCDHLAEIRGVFPGTPGCEECLQAGDSWVHLRICLTCGHVGCCDTSKNRHASSHFKETSHPIMKSLETFDDWAWCFIDELNV